MIQYERRRLELVSYFEAVRHAQQVQVDEIPLPATGSDIGRIYPGKNIFTNFYKIDLYNSTYLKFLLQDL
jgi:hypothetical protein